MQRFGRQRSTGLAKDEKIWGRRDLQNDLGTERFKDAAIHRKAQGRKDLGTQRSTEGVRDAKTQGRKDPQEGLGKKRFRECLDLLNGGQTDIQKPNWVMFGLGQKWEQRHSKDQFSDMQIWLVVFLMASTKLA